MDTKEKMRLLGGVDLGKQTAEDEGDQLENYFVETQYWESVYNGETDLVLAPKGGGKSAINSMLLRKKDVFRVRNILLVEGENPAGDPAFLELNNASELTNADLERIWKVYFLAMTIRELDNRYIHDERIATVKKLLADANIPFSLTTPRKTIVSRILDYIPKITFEGSLADPTGFVHTGKITFREPSNEEAEKGFVSLDSLFEKVNAVLKDNQVSIWILLDRLDAAFTAYADVELKALQALIRVYLYLKSYEAISLLLFLRTDIWEDIGRGGFTELSRINSDKVIKWDRSALMDLIVKRLLANGDVVRSYGTTADEVLKTYAARENFLEKIFPKQIGAGDKQSKTFDWVLKRLEDGKGAVSPRDLIYFFQQLFDIQVEQIEKGITDFAGGEIVSRKVFKEAFSDTSRNRVTKTLFAEYPDLRPKIERLSGRKAQQDRATLAEIWDQSESESEDVARELVRVGFFREKRSSKVTTTTYEVPFLYRPALDIKAGKQWAQSV